MKSPVVRALSWLLRPAAGQIFIDGERVEGLPPRDPESADTSILLLDDPLRNVDAKLRYEMRLELPSLLKAAGSP